MVADSVVVREASVEDSEGIARVRVLGWQDAYRGILPDSFLDDMSVASDAERMRTWQWGSDQTPHYVAEIDRELVGWVSLMVPGRDEDRGPTAAELVACYVLPSRWGQGIGPRMTAAAIETARRQGMTSMYLWVLDDNVQARRFYVRQGFAWDGTRKSEGPVPGLELAIIRMCRDI